MIRWTLSLLVLSLCSPVFGQSFRAKLVPDDGYRGDQFGRSVSVSGGYAIVGAYADGDNGAFSGSAYIFRKEGLGWVQEAKLLASDGDAADKFGDQVSIADDRAIVGAYRRNDNGVDKGSAYIFVRDGINWIEEAKLVASDGEYLDYFGSAVAISSDCAVVGSPGDYIDGVSFGSVYVFRRVGIDWVEEAKLTPQEGGETEEYIGGAVSISGEHLIIGSEHFYHRGGIAYIYRFEDPHWILEAELRAGDGSALNYFGHSVSISGDRALVGAYGDDILSSSEGSAYVFRRRDTSWIQEAKLIASDGAFYDEFGFAVSLSGDNAVIGAPYTDDSGRYSGSIYFFRRDGFSWVEESKLTARDADTSNFFGWSVSISGDDAVVGVFRNNDNGEESGSAYAFSGLSSDASVVVTLSSSSGNGSFDYDIGLSNNTDSALTVDIWIECFGLDGGHKTGQVTTDKRIERGHSYEHSGTQSLGPGAPPGDYSFIVNVGAYPNEVIASASTTYSKTALKKELTSTDVVPDTFRLLQNHPNPFNPTTSISFSIPASPAGEPQSPIVNLSVFDLLGREVASLVHEAKSPGTFEVTWDASGQPTGIYFYQLRAGSFVETRKLLLLR